MAFQGAAAGSFAAGLGTGLSLIVAIGAQNAFVLKQGLLRRHVFAVCLFCALSDAALIAALRSGHVAAAGLDVYDGEPRVHTGYLELENVVLLPHLGSATRETRDAMGMLALDGITAVLAGREPENAVV